MWASFLIYTYLLVCKLYLFYPILFLGISAVEMAALGSSFSHPIDSNWTDTIPGYNQWSELQRLERDVKRLTESSATFCSHPDHNFHWKLQNYGRVCYEQASKLCL